MAEPANGPGGQRHLDITAGREVVYCHQCDNEWYRDESGLQCPRCRGEATEIVSPDNDPRPLPEPRLGDEDIRVLHGHNPWEHQDSDPEEEDISHTMRDYRSHGRQNQARGAGANPDIMTNFQNMVANMMGPGLQHGEAGRSGPDVLYGTMAGPVFDGQPQIRTATFSHGGMRGGSTHITFTTGPGSAPHGENVMSPDFSRVLASLLGAMPPNSPHDNQNRNRGQETLPDSVPPLFAGLFQNLFNPANAVHGDAVYSQEALDRIISNLMEQNPFSNAPGPAPAADISALPKKLIDEKMLGTEGKAECSVCMDDVALGDEVVVLPCKHWFHEACATAWLSEHNTCPICRTGISGNGAAPSSTSQSGPASSRQPSSGTVPGGTRRPMHSTTLRSADRLERIQNAAGLGYASQPTSGQTSGITSQNPWAAPELEERPRRRYQVVGDSANAYGPVQPPPMPGAWDPIHRRSSHGQSQSRRSSGSGGSNGQGGGGIGGWLRRLGSGNGGADGNGR